MITALTVVVLVALSEAEDAVTPPLARAAEQALGDGAHVIVRRVGSMPKDDEAVALGGQLHADGLAELAWPEGQPRVARLHLYVASTSRWIDREIVFAATDAPVERGRTLGFALASALPSPPLRHY